VTPELERRGARFQEGDLALLIDRKGRRYVVTLKADGVFHTHVGTLPHDQIIGRQQGDWFRTSMGQGLLALKPTLSDYVLEMPRGSQVIYPKDLGNILMLADVFPGAAVIEAGLGSGALTAVLLRAVGPRGRVTTYEVREDMVEKALRNVRALAPDFDRHELRIGDVYQGIHERGVDRVVLDVPEPWRVVSHAGDALSRGGILLSFLPTVLQVHRLVEALTADARFQLIETVEVLLRPWNVTSRSVRPVHRMVAHTGFITTARLCAPKAEAQAPAGAKTAQQEREDGPANHD
jgi:tRNA (adenine57-N1/adenine58-N1)-methyltransferase